MSGGVLALFFPPTTTLAALFIEARDVRMISSQRDQYPRSHPRLGSG